MVHAPSCLRASELNGSSHWDARFGSAVSERPVAPEWKVLMPRTPAARGASLLAPIEDGQHA